jgi:hypothetical protein
MEFCKLHALPPPGADTDTLLEFQELAKLDCGAHCARALSHGQPASQPASQTDDQTTIRTARTRLKDLRWLAGAAFLDEAIALAADGLEQIEQDLGHLSNLEVQYPPARVCARARPAPIIIIGHALLSLAIAPPPGAGCRPVQCTHPMATGLAPRGRPAHAHAICGLSVRDLPRPRLGPQALMRRSIREKFGEVDAWCAQQPRARSPLAPPPPAPHAALPCLLLTARRLPCLCGVKRGVPRRGGAGRGADCVGAY